MYFLINTLSSTLGSNNKSASFYCFVKEQYENYIQLLLQNQDKIESLIRNTEELKSCGFHSFVNLMKHINETCLSILNYAYQGDLVSAINNLLGLCYNQKNTQRKLNDVYINYFKLSFDKKQTFYRCVDFDNTEVPDNCNHVPFELRHKAKRGRFNHLGIPCLYLSSSVACANNEIGSIENNKKRWIGSFIAKQPLYYLDFTIPTKEEIQLMTKYDQMSFLLTYPIKLLCLTKANNPDSPFCEEYLFSQLFFHILFFSKNDKTPKFDGIYYSSMADIKEKNLVIPSLYEKTEPPINGYSKYILDRFEQINVKEYANITT